MLLALTYLLLISNCSEYNKNLKIKDGFYFNCRGEGLKLNYPNHIWLFSPVPTQIEYNVQSNKLIDPGGMICCSINSEFIPHFYNNGIKLIYTDSCCLKCYNGKDPRLFNFYEFSKQLFWDSIQVIKINAIGKFLFKTFLSSDSSLNNLNNKYQLTLDNEIEILFSGIIDQLVLSSRSNPSCTVKLFLNNGRVLSKEIKYLPPYLLRLNSIQFINAEFDIE